MDFNVNVNVKFDATPALTGVVSTLAGVLNPAKVMPPAIMAPAISSQSSETEDAVVQEQTQSAPAVQEQPQAGTTTSATQEQPAQEQLAQEQTKEITDEMLRKIVGPITKSKGKETVFKILDVFGVNRVPDLKQEQRQAFIDKLNEL